MRAESNLFELCFASKESWYEVSYLTIDNFTMKWEFFRYPLLAKVHKSVGFGSAERCNDDDKRTVKLRLKDDGWWMRDPSSLRSVGMTSLGEIHHTPQNSSTSPSVLQYLALSTRVLDPKYCGTCTKVLIVTTFLWQRLSIQFGSALATLCQSQPIYELSPYREHPKSTNFIEIPKP